MSLRDNPGAAISGGAHVLLLAAILVSFSHAAKFDDAQETVPVDLMSNSEFNQIMKGEKTAPLSEKPLQKVEKLADIAEAKPPSILTPSKTDVAAPQTRAAHNDDPGRADEKTPPIPPARPVEDLAKQAPKPDESKPEPPKAEAPKPDAAKPVAAAPPTPESPDAVEPKPVARPKVEPKKLAAVEPKPKPVEPPKKPEPKFKPDELAKLLNDDKTKDPPPKDPPKPAPKQKSGDEAADPADKFDLSDISRILNKAMPQKKAATGEALQQLASLGAPTASAAKMSPSLWGQLDGILQDQYRHCWNYIGMEGQEKYVPQIHVQYGQDGALIGEPQLLNPPTDPNLRSLAESAIRAVRRCNPLRIPAQYQPYYDQWKGRIVRFDPEDML
ncbi:cell envelope biogenesis protein TolA [Methylocella sp.]|jgi:colicin import membrane protein|uniref:cell envelope biogenesis protein TolA n=1 Tax=Methylocella sp. TaxID=1978226 RepID=UPI003C29B7FA